MSVQEKLEEKLEKKNNILQENKDKCSKLFIKALVDNLNEDELVKQFENSYQEYDNFRKIVIQPKKYLSFRDRFEFFINSCSMPKYHDSEKILTKTIKYWKPKGIDYANCFEGDCNHMVLETLLSEKNKN
tara:strand:- start:1314 stop:1703 length:390 start_codon:yes stop_codon:yes gene_type:complete